MSELMTAEEFTQCTEQMFQQAINTFHQDGFVNPVLISIDASGEPGFLAPRTRFQDELPVVAEHLRTTGAVAAVLISEGWFAEVGLAGVVDPAALSTADQPNRRELVTALGMWPARGVFEPRAAEIVRIGPNAVLVDASALITTDSATRIASWLIDLLPQP